MRITENKLLSGYDGLTKGLTLISMIGGDRIDWDYRHHEGAMTDCREYASYILLRSGRRIPLARRLTARQAQSAAKIAADLCAACDISS